MTGNTILITGGNAGIGRGLAEAFHKLGNQVIVGGRRRDALDAMTSANPGMASIAMDTTSNSSIVEAIEDLLARFPATNVLINNAGIMRMEDLTALPLGTDDAEATIATNLLGPIRLTAALLPHLVAQHSAALINVTSGLAFVPHVLAPTYSATKSALHAYTIALRHQLRGTSVTVREIIPPYVQTGLVGDHQLSDPNAMPLDDFIAETMSLLDSAAPEIVVERARNLRFAAENGTIEANIERIIA